MHEIFIGCVTHEISIKRQSINEKPMKVECMKKHECEISSNLIKQKSNAIINEAMFNNVI